MAEKKYLTLQELEVMEACSEAREEFEKKFGQKAALSRILKWIRELNRPDWEAWLLDQAPDLTESLLKLGADVHADDDGALCWAAKRGRTETVKVLLEHGANVHANDDGALCWAAERGHTEIIKVLLKHGADVHANDDEALSSAAKNGHTETVKVLLEHGADVHADNDWALCLAAEYGHTETVKVLKKAMKKSEKK